MDGFGFPPSPRFSSSAAAACVFVYLEPKENKRAKAKGSPTEEMRRLASVSADRPPIDRALRKVGSNVHKETFLALFLLLCQCLIFPMVYPLSLYARLRNFFSHRDCLGLSG